VPEWRQQIPEAIRGEKTWDKFKDPAAFYQSYHAMEKMQGSMVSIPGKDAKPEQVAAFREKLGVPKDPGGYTPPQGEGLDQARWQRWTGHAHKLGLTPEQLTGLATLEAEERADQGRTMRQSFTAGLDALKQEWGEGVFAKNVTLASRAVDRHMSPEGKKFLDDSGLGDHPELVKAWASVGALLAEDRYIEGRVAGLPSVDEAKAEIAMIRAAGKAHPANNPSLPGHHEAAAKLEGLYRLAHPGKAA